MDLENELQTWRTWISGPIHDEIVYLVLGRQIWRQYIEIVNGAPTDVRDAGGQFHDWVSRNHSHAIGSAIRRQSDRHRDAVGLARLLDRMARYPRALTLDRYLEGSEKENEADVHRRWVPFHVTGGGMLDPTVPASDLDRLLIDLGPVIRWVNKAIAHNDDKKRTVEQDLGITFLTLHEAVDKLVAVYNRYSLLLTHTYVFLNDILTDPWEYAFRFQWVDEPTTWTPHG